MTKVIKLEDEVYNRLTSIGGFKESYSDIVKKLLDHYHNFTINPNPKVKKQK